MSRTKETVSQEQPCKAFISFNGQSGNFGLIRDGGDMVPLALPLTFIVLDADAFNIGGKTSLKQDAPRWKSNMGHQSHGTNLKISLSSDSKVVAEGKWADLKSKPELSTAKWQRLIFALADVGSGKELVRISLKGKTLFEWGTFTKTVDPCGNYAIQVKEVVSKPSTTGPDSFVPIFTKFEKVSEETLALASEMDSNVLQPWFSQYFGSGAKTIDAPGEVDEDSGGDPSFEAKTPETPNKVLESVISPVNDSDDLPF